MSSQSIYPAGEKLSKRCFVDGNYIGTDNLMRECGRDLNHLLLFLSMLSNPYSRTGLPET